MTDDDSSYRPHPRLEVTSDGPVLTITLDDPASRNAQTPSLWHALTDIAADLPPETRAVVFTGTGDGFSSGLDRALMTRQGLPGERSLHGMASAGANALHDELASYQRAFAIWAEVPAIVIAAVHGYAVGAGFQLALAADLRIVGDDVQLIMKETSYGLVPDLTGTHPLVQLVGYAKALELCATGRPMRAEEAVRTGLASLKVPAEEVYDAARDLADAILASPPAAVRKLKQLLRFGITSTPQQQAYAERSAQIRLLTGNRDAT